MFNPENVEALNEVLQSETLPVKNAADLITVLLMG